MTAAPVRVLVIDDEPPIRKLLRLGLGAQGYQTLEAANGKEALDLLSRKSRPDHPRLGASGRAGSRLAAHDARSQ